MLLLMTYLQSMMEQSRLTRLAIIISHWPKPFFFLSMRFHCVFTSTISKLHIRAALNFLGQRVTAPSDPKSKGARTPMTSSVNHSRTSFFNSCLLCLVLYVSNNIYFLFRSKGKRLPIDKAEIVPAVQFSSKASSLPKSPPPPPKQPPPPPQLKRPPSSGSVPSKPPSVPGRAGLLSQIQKGTKLKRAATNDRSAPRVWKRFKKLICCYDISWFHSRANSVIKTCNIKGNFIAIFNAAYYKKILAWQYNFWQISLITNANIRYWTIWWNQKEHSTLYRNCY